MPDDWQASDVAAAAARKLLADTGTDPGDIDLLLFAAASQDMIEPATSHMTADRLGLRCPAFDVKNACNSVLNALETAHALVAQGSYRRILIACGESPSRAVRWSVPDLRAYLTSIPDTPCPTPVPRSWSRRPANRASSAAGSPPTPPPGASAPCPPAAPPTRGRGAHLLPARRSRPAPRLRAARPRGARRHPGPARPRLARHGRHLRPPGVRALSGAARRPFRPAPRQDPVTITDHGNAASASLPLQLLRARESGRAAPATWSPWSDSPVASAWE